MEIGQTTTSALQRETQFALIARQLTEGVKVADEAFGSTTPHYRAACHLIGIASYVLEMAQQVKRSMEVGK